MHRLASFVASDPPIYPVAPVMKTSTSDTPSLGEGGLWNPADCGEDSGGRGDPCLRGFGAVYHRVHSRDLTAGTLPRAFVQVVVATRLGAPRPVAIAPN